MTIIVYDKATGRVLVDKKSCYDPSTGLKPIGVNKILDLGNFSHFVASGSSMQIFIIAHELSRLLKGGMDITGSRVRMEGLPPDAMVEGLIVMLSECKVLYSIFSEGWLEVLPLQVAPESEVVLGCGTSWFRAYRMLGMTVYDAFLATCEHHDGCGLGHDVLLVPSCSA